MACELGEEDEQLAGQESPRGHWYRRSDGDVVSW